MTLGLLDEISPGTELTAFVVRDRERAGCLVELSGGLAKEAVEVQA